MHDSKQWNYNSFELFTFTAHPQTISITDAHLMGINLFVDLIKLRECIDHVMLSLIYNALLLRILTIYPV